MPPKGSAKKKKKATEKKPEAFPVPRDLSEPAPIDGREGALGIEHLEVQERIRGVQLDLVLWKVSEAVRTGALELDLSEASLDELPEELLELPWLTVLDLSRNFFVASVFEDLKTIPGLRAVNLATNLLNGELPAALGDLPPGLEELCLDENVISALPADAARLTELTWLSLRKNLLTALPPPALASWSKLVHLDLRDNKLTALPGEISGCVALRELLVSNNALDSLPEGIRSCTALEVLLLQNNALAALPLGLAGCRALATLDVSRNKLTTLPGPVLAALPNLVSLHASDNKITDLPPEVGVLAQLQVLSFSNNQIKALPEEVGGLTKLREVYFNGNALTALPAAVAGWAALEEASFRNCKLKGLPVEVGTTWKALRVLDVRAKKKDTCKVSEDLRAALKDARLMGVIATKAKAKGKKKTK